MNEWSLIIAGGALIAILALWHINTKNKKEKEEKAVRSMSYIWAAQGPFHNGEESAIAFARSIYVLNGEEELESNSARILEHAKSYNQDPKTWENNRKKAIISYQGSYTKKIKKKMEEAERLRENRDKKNLPAVLVAIQLNLGCDSELLYDWITDQENTEHDADKIEKLWKNNSAELDSTDWKILSWSENPGSYEKHLKRRLESPYFPSISRPVIEDDLKAMQDLDRLRYVQCLKDMARFTTEEVKPLLMGDGPSFKEALHIKECLESIMQKAMAVDGEAIKIAKQASEQRETCMKYMRDIYKDDLNAMRKLERAETATFENNKFYTTFIAQALDVDGPIQDGELVSTLLTQDPSIISITISVIESDKREVIKNYAVELLHNARKNGYIDPQFDQKIQALSGNWPTTF